MNFSNQSAFDDYWRDARGRLDEAFVRQLTEFFDYLPDVHRAVVGEALIGGKRLRGCLVCLLNDALGGTPAAAIPRAMAVECVQTASLIHDDFIDGDTLRRDRPATWTVHGARRAVLLGDLIFATALRRMAELGREDGTVLAEAIATMAAGAYQEPLVSSDLAQEGSVDPVRLYPHLVYLKTGALFGAAARLGALAAEAPTSVAALAFEYGARVGEAYQIADDLHDWLEAPPDAGQCSLLAPALWHFCADAVAAEGFDLPAPEQAERLRPILRERMIGAIEHRLQQALATVDLFPGDALGLLKAAPRAIVGVMPPFAR